ncbi:MAG TPA: SCO family protein [Acidimicrobiales bacterium]|nr:SCO family protein [Acidimicrobiales bacterium]
MRDQAVLSEAERAAAFAEPPPKVPRRTVGLVVLACLVLGFGGIVVDHFFAGPSATPPIPPASATSVPQFPRPTAPDSPSLGAPLSKMMELTPLRPQKAPPLRLVSASGRAVSLSSFRGKVVVLSFFDASCDDICPVIEREVKSALSDLGRSGARGRVEFLTVNTDPLAVSPADARPAEAAMAAVPQWQFLTGSVPRLNSVWRTYGVSIEAQASSGTVSHSEALYFIDPSGVVRARATPFANQVAKGTFELSAALVRRFGEGIASEVTRLSAKESP